MIYPVIYDGVRATAHAIERLLERCPDLELSPEGAAALLAAAMGDGLVWDRGLPNGCFMVRSVLLPRNALVAKFEGGELVVVTVVDADRYGYELLRTLRPLLRAVGRMMGEEG